MRKLLFFILVSPITLFSQNTDLSNVVGDLIFLTEQYVAPAAEAATYQSSGGWYTSAKKKGLWDVELSLQGNFLFIPKRESHFLVIEEDLNNLTIQGVEDGTEIPTALGGDSEVVLEGVINGEAFEFDAPEGLNESYVNHYQLQAGLGLWAGTTLIGRFSPKIKINKTQFQVLGVGIQHNISQWIPALKASSVSIAALLTYTSYVVSDEFKPANMVLGYINAIDVNGETFQFNILASKKISHFDFSAGVGINLNSFDYEVGGEGEILLSVLNQALATFDDSKTNLKVDFGVDYEMRDFSINSMFTIGKFNNVLLGVNYNFQ